MEESEEIIRASETKEQIRKEHPEYSEEKVEARYGAIQRLAEDIEAHPYDHCDVCEYKRAGECKVYDRFQKYPRKADGTGGLGMCIRIGGKGN